MTIFFWTCLLLGGGVVLVQLGATLLGLDHDAPHDVPGHGVLSEGMHLLSVRALAAGTAFFGVGGVAALRMGLPLVVTLGAAVGAGAVAAVGVASVMRGMRRLESDQSFRLADAVGLSGEVYLSIPPEKRGLGKVHVTVSGRLMELDAMTTDDALPTGARVLVIDAVAPVTVIVVRQPPILDEGAGDDSDVVAE